MKKTEKIGKSNPVAKNLNRFNKPTRVKPKKGKGSYKRKDRYKEKD